LKDITDREAVSNVVADRDAAAEQSPRPRALPLDVMVKTYRAHKDEYDSIQAAVPSSADANVSASVLLISGCQDDQLSLDGISNGLFTETLLGVWSEGQWTGDYSSFHQAIVAKMPATQQPNLMTVGEEVGFVDEDPLQQ
jgi:hypothetical protein